MIERNSSAFSAHNFRRSPGLMGFTYGFAMVGKYSVLFGASSRAGDRTTRSGSREKGKGGEGEVMVQA